MGIADYQPQRLSIPVKGLDEPMRVRGLSLDDVAVLLNEYMPDVDTLFELYDVGVNDSTKVAATAQFAIKLAQQAPALVSHLIALAADEPAATAAIRRMPMTVHVEALKAVALLTFEEAGGARKFFESLKMLLAGIAPTAKQTVSPT